MMSLVDEITQRLNSLRLTSLKNSSHCTLTPDSIVGNFKIHKRLGRGRFSTVWAASCEDGKECALKIYRFGSSNERYFENEVKIMDRIKNGSPRIIGYHGAYNHSTIEQNLVTRSHPYIVLDRAGDSVSKLIKYCVRTYDHGVPIDAVKKIMRDVFTALSYIHRCGIIHADIKPGNLLMSHRVEELIVDAPTSRDFITFIADFGSSTISTDLFTKHPGTTQYLAPELILELPYTNAIDIWSAFITCFELLTGDLLFDVFSECKIIYGEDVDTLNISDHDSNTNNSNSDNITSSTEESNEDSIDINDDNNIDTDDTDDTDNSSIDESSEDEIKVNIKLLLLMEKILGPPPKEFTRQGRIYYNRRGKLKNTPKIKQLRLAELLFSNYEKSMEECLEIENFLLCGLKYIPQNRITASQALRHPWLKY